jgi:L-asparagine transporter-like permease
MIDIFIDLLMTDESLAVFWIAMYSLAIFKGDVRKKMMDTKDPPNYPLTNIMAGNIALLALLIPILHLLKLDAINSIQLSLRFFLIVFTIFEYFLINDKKKQYKIQS